MKVIEQRARAGAVEMSCRIVTAYVGANPIPASRLSALIADVHATLAGLGPEPADDEPSPNLPATPAQIRASLGPGGLRSFESGKRYASLRRHLGSLGLTPAAYRSKWGLPADYPMVCPVYSARRAALARAIGLGRPLPTADMARREAR